MRSSITLCFLFFFISSCNSQSKPLYINDTIKHELEVQLNRMTQAFITNDYETLVKFTYPKLVEMAGGSDKAIDHIKKVIEGMKDDGMSFDTLFNGRPTIFVKAGTEIHTLIPQTILLNVRQGKLKTESYLLAITQDEGKTWYFIDTANIDNNDIKEIFPNYNFELKIRPSKDPILIDSK